MNSQTDQCEAICDRECKNGKCQVIYDWFGKHEEKFDFLFSSKKLITFEDSRIIIMKHSKKLLVRAMKVIFYHLQNFVVSLSKKRQQLSLLRQQKL